MLTYTVVEVKVEIPEAHMRFKSHLWKHFAVFLSRILRRDKIIKETELRVCSEVLLYSVVQALADYSPGPYAAC